MAFSPFRTPSSPTFLLTYFGSAFAVAFPCPSGPKTRTARSADKSWTKWGDHAMVCGCGGDRVTRHNLVRDVVHSAANYGTNLATVLEKPGGPFGPSGGQEAWDFSVAGALRVGFSLPDPSALASIFASVESRKNSFLSTASQCTHASISFCPLVLVAVCLFLSLVLVCSGGLLLSSLGN